MSGMFFSLSIKCKVDVLMKEKKTESITSITSFRICNTDLYVDGGREKNINGLKSLLGNTTIATMASCENAALFQKTSSVFRYFRALNVVELNYSWHEKQKK